MAQHFITKGLPGVLPHFKWSPSAQLHSKPPSPRVVFGSALQHNTLKKGAGEPPAPDSCGSD